MTRCETTIKNCASYQNFEASVDGNGGGRTPSFKQFVDQRRDFLLNDPELNKPTPKIIAVSTPENPTSNQPVEITAELDKTVAADSVLLYYSTDRHSVFNSTVMSKRGNKFVGKIPAVAVGTKVYYYVEASAVKNTWDNDILPGTRGVRCISLSC